MKNENDMNTERAVVANDSLIRCENVEVAGCEPATPTKHNRADSHFF